MVGHDESALPAIALSTLAIFYVIGGAMHDIVRGDAGMLVWMFLAFGALVFCILYRLALRSLNTKERIFWLAGTVLLLLLCGLTPINSLIRPKYAEDPKLAATFLAAGLPVAMMLIHRLVRETRPQTKH
jgi:hypothetical protein